MKHILNDHVKSQLRWDFPLYIVWLGLVGKIDSDTDPVHNPDWVEGRKDREDRALTEARNTLAELRYGFLRQTMQEMVAAHGRVSLADAEFRFNVETSDRMAFLRMVKEGELTLQGGKLALPEGWSPTRS